MFYDKNNKMACAQTQCNLKHTATNTAMEWNPQGRNQEEIKEAMDR